MITIIVLVPNRAKTPHVNQISRDIPTDPVRTSTSDGDTKIPEPTIVLQS